MREEGGGMEDGWRRDRREGTVHTQLADTDKKGTQQAVVIHHASNTRSHTTGFFHLIAIEHKREHKK
jgi:hypothetical protein